MKIGNGLMCMLNRACNDLAAHEGTKTCLMEHLVMSSPSPYVDEKTRECGKQENFVEVSKAQHNIKCLFTYIWSTKQ